MMHPYNYAPYHNARRIDWALVTMFVGLLLLNAYIMWVQISGQACAGCGTIPTSVWKMELHPLNDLLFGPGQPINYISVAVVDHMVAHMGARMITRRSEVKPVGVPGEESEKTGSDDVKLQDDIADFGRDLQQLMGDVVRMGTSFGGRTFTYANAEVGLFGQRVSAKAGDFGGGGGSGGGGGGGRGGSGGGNGNLLLVGHSGVLDNKRLASLISAAFHIPFLVINCARLKSSNQSLDDLFIGEVSRKWYPFYGSRQLPPMFVLLDGVDDLTGEIERQKELVNFIVGKRNRFSKMESSHPGGRHHRDILFFASVPFNSSFPLVNEKQSCTKAEKSAESENAKSQEIDDNEIRNETKQHENGSQLVGDGDETGGANPEINAPSDAEVDAEKSHDSQSERGKSHKSQPAPDLCQDTYGEPSGKDAHGTETEQALIPELVSAFPNVVTFPALNESDLARVLTDPKFSLLAQYQTLFSSLDVKLSFTETAVSAITSVHLSDRSRDLHSILESVLEKPLSDVVQWKNVSTVIITAEVVVGVAAPVYIFEN